MLSHSSELGKAKGPIYFKECISDKFLCPKNAIIVIEIINIVEKIKKEIFIVTYKFYLLLK